MSIKKIDQLILIEEIITNYSKEIDIDQNLNIFEENIVFFNSKYIILF